MRMLTHSACVCACVCVCIFFSLERHSSNNNIRINLLKLLTVLFAAHSDATSVASECRLIPVLERLLEDKSAVIVESLANKLLVKLRPN